jgi:hypothetical protein
MACWAVVVSAERYAAERLFQYESLDLPAAGPAPGDEVVLVAVGSPPVVFGLGRVRDGAVAYTHRSFDAPVPASDAPAHDGPGVHPLDPVDFAALADRVGADRRVDVAKREWLVSVDLPIEAPSAAEAVRAFWTYVTTLGPRELPAFVAPVGDELAMRAYVLGEPANLDPEEDADDDRQ